jgi:16S rRNA (uracil1498-N3)-methyltransferase
VDHDDRPPVATWFGAGPFVAGSLVTLGEGPAHHARVKRLDAGDRVRLTDGAGQIALGAIAELRKSSLEITIDSVERVAAPPPIHVRAPIADRDRMLWLAEKAAELGVASWQAVRFHRSASVSPRGEGAAFAEKIRARMIAAVEQSGGAWLPRILADAGIEDVARDPGAFAIVLDVRGGPLLSAGTLDAGRPPVVLFGPEGGIEPHELKALTDAGWRSARLADTTLRFETAGVAAIAVLRAAQLLKET